LAIYCLDNYLTGANVDDEIVDFTHEGGWDKIDVVLCEHWGSEIIFTGWEAAMYWAENLVDVAKVLKVSTSPLLRQEELTLASCPQEHRPEAGEIMHKYAKKWLHFVHYGDDTTDSSAESNASDSDSD
jgi:hypothetical protein